jgi:DNA-binding MarR family transcriptional regulator
MIKKPVASASDALLLENQVCFPLYAASRLVTRLYQPLLDPLGLTYPQYVVLMILWEDAPCAVSHVGDRALLNTNTLTPLLKRLQQLGYVTRTRRSDDERVIEINLTKSGLALKKQCACVPQRLAESIAYPVQKAFELKRSLEALIQALQQSQVRESS